jgi:hypothetical protein
MVTIAPAATRPSDGGCHGRLLFCVSARVAGDGGFEVVVGDAGGHQGEDTSEIASIADDAPGII